MQADLCPISYPNEDAPLFRRGAAVSLTSALVLIVTGAGLSLYVIKTNRKKAAIMESLGPDHVVSSEERTFALFQCMLTIICGLVCSSLLDLSQIQIVSFKHHYWQ